MSGFICEYCKKTFSSAYNLNIHKKTAKYCLDIQKNAFNIQTPMCEQYVCDYCNLQFNIKANYNNHLLKCKEKKEYDQITQEEKYKREIEGYKREIEGYKQKDIHYKEIEVENVFYKKEIDRIRQEKNEEIRQLKEQIKEKDQYIQNTPHTTIYQTNNNNSKYEFNFQAVFDKLPSFTEENVKERVLSILPRHLIEANDYNLILNFCSNFGRKMADMAILTDKSRGLIFIKNKDGEKEKHQVKGFVNKCLDIGHPECINLFNSTRNLVEIYGIRNEIMPEDEARCFGDLTILREYLTTKTLDKTVRTISGVLTDNCSYVSKLLPGSVEHKMIEEIDD